MLPTQLRLASILAAVAAVGAIGCRFDGAGVGGDDSAAVDGSAGDDDVDGPPGLRPDAAPPDAPPPPPPPGVLHARPVVSLVTLDGLDLDFVAAGVAFKSFDILDGELLEQLDGYTGSARVRFGAMHDATYVYFFVAVTDSVYEVGSTDIWNDDGIVLFLDAANDALGPFDADDHAVVVRGDGMWDDYGTTGTAVTLSGTRLTTTAGYNLELRITKSSLSATIGARMGFDLSLTDDDRLSDEDYDGYSLWYRANRPACPSCCSGPDSPYCDTTMFGSLVLD